MSILTKSSEKCEFHKDLGGLQAKSNEEEFEANEDTDANENGEGSSSGLKKKELERDQTRRPIMRREKGRQVVWQSEI
jgi:predicted HNH restriction endonuclease